MEIVILQKVRGRLCIQKNISLPKSCSFMKVNISKSSAYIMPLITQCIVPLNGPEIHVKVVRKIVELMGDLFTWVEPTIRCLPWDRVLSAPAPTPTALLKEVSHDGGVPDKTFSALKALPIWGKTSDRTDQNHPSNMNNWQLHFLR